ncbi:MAG: capsular biosynthesis protein [Leclercia adecarboxylata]|nr:capsular biosynthesis protein [uncultured Leclercia sp.]MDU4840649.1 capsular biosynthesis protein [Leclercia adecarboxylata]
MNLNTGHYLQTFTLFTLIFCGLVQYFTGELAVLWLPFVMTLLMAGFLVLQTRDEPLRLDAQEAIILTLYGAFIVLSVISTLFQGGALITLVGFKNEIGLSLVMVCLLLGFCRESQIYQVTRALYWVFYIQFPVAIYQLIFVLPERVALYGEGEKWDSVVGTFGGDPMGGGNTAAMGLFCLLIMLLKVSEYKHGLTSFKSMALHIVLGFVMCIIGEVKFVILLSPLLLGWVWLTPSWVKEASKVNLTVLLSILIGMALLIVVAVIALAYSYSSAYGGDTADNPFAVFLGSMDYIFDPDFITPGGEVGRFTSLLFWIQHNDLSGLPGTLFGYGLNATNSGSSVSPGFLHQYYNLYLDSTSLSMLLWEVGVVGTLLFVGLIIYTLKSARPEPVLSVEQLDAPDVHLLSFAPAFNVFAIACLLSLPYSQIMMITPMLQFLFYMSLGSSLIIRRTVRRYTGHY